MAKNKKAKTIPKIEKINSASEDTFEIIFSGADDAEKFLLYRKDFSNMKFSLVGTSAEHIFTDKVERDKTYWYRIASSKLTPTGKISTKESKIRFCVLTDIKKPTKLSAKTEGERILLSWSGVKGAYGYRIYRRNDVFSQYLPLCDTEETSFCDEKIISGQLYHYVVQALIKDKDESNEEMTREGGLSKRTSCVWLDSPAVLQKKVFSKNVTVTLRLTNGADGYILERSDSESGEYMEVARTSSNLDFNFTDKDTKHFKTYFYRAKSFKKVKDEIYFSEPTKAFSVKTK